MTQVMRRDDHGRRDDIARQPMGRTRASRSLAEHRLTQGFGGTLVVDESDLRQTDGRAEVVKILNNGTGRGFPVLRSEANGRLNPMPSCRNPPERATAR